MTNDKYRRKEGFDFFFFFLTFQVIQVFNKIVCYGEFEDTFIRFK